MEIMSPYKTQELIWASARELLNNVHADEIGCHVITVTHDILKKLSLVGKTWMSTPLIQSRCSMMMLKKSDINCKRNTTVARR